MSTRSVIGLHMVSAFSVLTAITDSVHLHDLSCSDDIQCDSWKLKSSWTQGGYAAACNVEDSTNLDDSLLFRIYLTRNLYHCSEDIKALKIVNNYFDQDGKLCHLASGEDACPGTALSGQKAWIKVELLCSGYTCHFQYHRCDVCSLVPWYSWWQQQRTVPCKEQMQYINNNNNNSHGVCIRCDGVLVGSKQCLSKAHGKYFVDLKESEPSWSEWKSASDCDITGYNNSKCSNVKIGNMTWKRFCSYPGHPVALDPKYCKSNLGDTISRPCNVTTPQCAAKTNQSESHSSKASNVWIVIIIIATFLLVVSMLCIFVNYAHRRSGYDKLFTTGIFSSCATQTSPKYSPRRIINEPEYALLGDWRQNVVQCSQPENKRSYGDPVYWGVEDDCCLSDDDVHDGESPVPTEVGECCELDADARRALYAKTHRWR